MVSRKSRCPQVQRAGPAFLASEAGRLLTQLTVTPGGSMTTRPSSSSRISARLWLYTAALYSLASFPLICGSAEPTDTKQAAGCERTGVPGDDLAAWAASKKWSTIPKMAAAAGRRSAAPGAHSPVRARPLPMPGSPFPRRSWVGAHNGGGRGCVQL